jgi:hypothetical protein
MASRKALDIDAARADQRSGALPIVINLQTILAPRSGEYLGRTPRPGCNPRFARVRAAFGNKQCFRSAASDVANWRSSLNFILAA